MDRYKKTLSNRRDDAQKRVTVSGDMMVLALQPYAKPMFLESQGASRGRYRAGSLEHGTTTL